MEFLRRYRWPIVGLGLAIVVVGFLAFRPDKLFVDDAVDEALDEAFAPSVATTTAPPASTTTTAVTVAPEDGSSTTTTTTTTEAPTGPTAVTGGAFYGIDHSAEGTATVYEQDGRFVLRRRRHRHPEWPGPLCLGAAVRGLRRWYPAHLHRPREDQGQHRRTELRASARIRSGGPSFRARMVLAVLHAVRSCASGVALRTEPQMLEAPMIPTDPIARPMRPGHFRWLPSSAPPVGGRTVPARGRVNPAVEPARLQPKPPTRCMRRR